MHPLLLLLALAAVPTAAAFSAAHHGGRTGRALWRQRQRQRLRAAVPRDGDAVDIANLERAMRSEGWGGAWEGTMFQDGAAGNGMVARRDLDAGAEVVAVPLGLSLVAEVAVASVGADADVDLDAAAQRMGGGLAYVRDLLAVTAQLALAKADADGGGTGAAAAHAASMPWRWAATQHVLAWSDADVARLKGTSAHGDVVDFRATAAAGLEALAAALPAVADDPALVQASFALVLSRSFTLATTSAAVPPLADLLNHDAVPNCEFFQRYGLLIIRTTRPVRKGEPVTISYGAAKTNTELLLSHAFVLPDAASAVVRVDLAGLADENDGESGVTAAEQVAALRSWRLDPAGHEFTLRRGRLPYELLVYLAIAAAPSRDALARWVDGGAGRQAASRFGARPPTPSAATTAAVGRAVQGLCRRALLGLTFTTPPDEGEGGGGGGNAGTAASLREYEAAVLRGHAFEASADPAGLWDAERVLGGAGGDPDDDLY